MAPKPRRPLLAPSSAQSPIERVLRRLDTLLDLVDAVVEAHNHLDARFEQLHYQVQFILDTITVKRPRPAGTIVTDPRASPYEEGTLYAFWQTDGPAYVANVRAEALALERQIAATAAGNPTRDDIGDRDRSATVADPVDLARVSRTRH